MSLGVLFAITDGDLRLLKVAGDDDAVMEHVEAIEERWSQKWLAELDKAWEPIQRALDGGRLEFGPADAPAARAILGGELLTSGEDSIVTLVEPEDVPVVAAALAAIDREAFEAGYRTIDADAYPELGEDDLEYAWENFLDTRDLDAKAAAAGRAVIFTADG
jgi:hypothetical protein